MTTINVVELPGVYKVEDGQALCIHEEVELEHCCPVASYDCSCRGLPAVICMNYDCTGILDHEVDELMGRFEYEEDY